MHEERQERGNAEKKKGEDDEKEEQARTRGKMERDEWRVNADDRHE
jgi:hypothetical protein